VARVERGKRRVEIEQRAERLARLGRHRRGGLAAGASRTERAAFARAERERSGRIEWRAVPHAFVQSGREAERAHERPEQPERGGLDPIVLNPFQQVERVAQQIEAVRMWIGRRKTEHDLGQGRGGGIPVEPLGEPDPDVRHVERHEQMEVAMLLQYQVGHAIAQELQGGAEAAPRPKGALGDGALHSMLPGREADDLGGFAVAQRRKHDRGSDDQRHAEIYAQSPARTPARKALCRPGKPTMVSYFRSRRFRT